MSALALAVLPRVCRTGAYLFQFATAMEAIRGWGRDLRRAVGAWVTKTGDLIINLLHNFHLECCARIHKLRV